MRRLLLGLIACFAVVAMSCKDNAFDFSHLDAIDEDGNWGIPVANLQYTIEDVLNKSDFIPLNVNADGMLQLEYATEVDSLISSDQILHSLADKKVNLSKQNNITLPTLPMVPGISVSIFSDTLVAELPNDKVLLELARIKSGLFQFSFSHNFPIQLSVELTCPQLTDASGNAFSQTISCQKEDDDQISLAGYTLAPKAGNKLQFALRFNLTTTGGTLPSKASISYAISVENIAFSEFQGKIAPISLDVSKSIDLKLNYLNKTMGGNFTVYNPDIHCEVYNMFPIAANIVLNEAALHGPNVQPASLISVTPANVTVPASMSGFREVALPFSSFLTFNPKMNEARVSAHATLNPEGFKSPTLVVREGEFIHFKFSFKLPLNFKMENVTFCDTIDFNKTKFPELDGIDNIVIRCLFENDLPLDLFCQVYFFDTETRTFKDSLFNQRHLLIGNYGNQPSVSEAFITKDNFNDIKNLLNCDKIILTSTLYTDDHQVCINNRQKLRIRIGTNFNLDLIEFSHNDLSSNEN